MSAKNAKATNFDLKRRSMLKQTGRAVAGLLAAPAIVSLFPLTAAARSQYFSGTLVDGGVSVPATNFDKIPRQYHRQMVRYFSREPVGTIVIDGNNHFLYRIWGNNTALRYGVGLGKEGFEWYGRSKIARKARWPLWVPPEEMRERQPELPEKMDGGPENPLGARALYLFDGERDTGYRIHGTTAPWTIGKSASSGCVRMCNEDVIDLFRRCPIGTAVHVQRQLQERAGVEVDPS